MHETSFGAAHTDINDDHNDTGSWAKVLNSIGAENGIDGIQQKIEQMETPTLSERELWVDSVVWRYTETEWMIAAQVSCMTNQLDAKEISSLGGGYFAQHSITHMWESTQRILLCRL